MAEEKCKVVMTRDGIANRKFQKLGTTLSVTLADAGLLISSKKAKLAGTPEAKAAEAKAKADAKDAAKKEKDGK